MIYARTFEAQKPQRKYTLLEQEKEKRQKLIESPMTAQSARFLRKIGEVELLTLRAAILFSNVPRRRAPGFQAVGDGGDKNIGTIYFSQFLPPP